MNSEENIGAGSTKKNYQDLNIVNVLRLRIICRK